MHIGQGFDEGRKTSERSKIHRVTIIRSTTSIMRTFRQLSRPFEERSCQSTSSICLVGSTHPLTTRRLVEGVWNTFAGAPDRGDRAIMPGRMEGVNSYVVFFLRHYIKLQLASRNGWSALVGGSQGCSTSIRAAKLRIGSGPSVYISNARLLAPQSLWILALYSAAKSR